MSSTTSQVSVDFRPWVALPVEASRRILLAERAKRKCPIDNIRGSTKCRLRARKLGSTLRTARKGDHMKFGSRQTILGATGILMVCLVGVAMLSGQAAQEPKPQMAEELFKNVQILDRKSTRLNSSHTVISYAVFCLKKKKNKKKTNKK